MTNFRIDTHKKSGHVMLYIETPNGFLPVMGWDGVEGVKEFAFMLMDYYDNRKSKDIKDVSENILRQALGDDYFDEE